jgi:hypothetical protein
VVHVDRLVSIGGEQRSSASDVIEITARDVEPR